MNKVQQWSIIVIVGIGLSACTSSTNISPNVNSYIYNGINFGNDRDESFKQGVRDACRTADGQYTKNRELFTMNISYKTGWEDGRMQCHGK